ncbi:MAG: LPP20 family lipoprotein [Candidatus Krumholzibacteriota bacterium]|nr:LPP20 family lipoprotein [Candidatus Krumholzibacteriota bacterium]
MKGLFSIPILSFILLTIYFSSCSGVNADNIKWVDKIDVYYPEKVYLTGLGIGDTKEKADNRAFQNISKSIKLHVRSDELSKREYQQSGNRKSKSTFSYEEKIRVETETVLENASIVKHGYDESKEMYYSLAALRKDKYSDILSSKIEESQKRGAKLLAAIEKEESKVIKLGNMFDLEREIEFQRNAFAVLRVVSDNYSKYKPRPDPLQVDKMINDFLLNKFVFSLRVKGDMTEEINSILSDVLTREGYYISGQRGKSSDVVIDGNMKIRRMPGSGKRWVLLSWKFDLSFTDSRSGEIILSYSMQDRQQQPSVEMARERILYHFREDYAEDVISRFEQKLHGYVNRGK